jgi:hypothetical protein
MAEYQKKTGQALKAARALAKKNGYTSSSVAVVTKPATMKGAVRVGSNARTVDVR